MRSGEATYSGIQRRRAGFAVSSGVLNVTSRCGQLKALLRKMSLQMGDSSDVAESTGDLPETPRGKRSIAWQHFEEELVMVNGVPMAVCKYCGLKMKATARSGTSSFRNHIGESCPKIGDVERHKFLLAIKKLSTDVFVFNPKRTRELIAMFCIDGEIPFNKFNNQYFQELMASMQPTFSVPDRHVVRDDCIRLYENMKKDLRKEFENLDSRVCLTSDLWTSNQKLGYMCVTAHYIDANYKLHKKIISFKNVKYPHTGLAIEDALSRSIADWGIKKKLLTITLDNASNNTKAVASYLQNEDHGLLVDGLDFHVRCSAHILNILVQDGLIHVKEAIKKIRELYRHIDTSPSRLQTFNSIAVLKGLPKKAGLTLDLPHRWNSTFDMTEEAYPYKNVLNSYANETKEVAAPTEEEWAAAMSIGKVLKAFEEATLIVSTDRKPSAHMFFNMVLCIKNALLDAAWQTDHVLNNLAQSMATKFSKYWAEASMNTTLVIAAILDPTQKMDYVEFFYGRMCLTEDLIEDNIERTKQALKRYYDSYAENVKSTVEKSMPRQFESLLGSPVLGKRKLDEEFIRYKARRRARKEPGSEIDAYLEEPALHTVKDFDVLGFWEQNTIKYPVLAAMARDFLAIPLSTVSSESAFSLGGRILGDTRASLKPDSLEALVCGKDWLTKRW